MKIRLMNSGRLNSFIQWCNILYIVLQNTLDLVFTTEWVEDVQGQDIFLMAVLSQRYHFASFGRFTNWSMFGGNGPCSCPSHPD